MKVSQTKRLRYYITIELQIVLDSLSSTTLKKRLYCHIQHMCWHLKNRSRENILHMMLNTLWRKKNIISWLFKKLWRKESNVCWHLKNMWRKNIQHRMLNTCGGRKTSYHGCSRNYGGGSATWAGYWTTTSSKCCCEVGRMRSNLTPIGKYKKGASFIIRMFSLVYLD